jgi:alkylation response protein AidB-like acyl-CoA dehydrogenase
VDFALSDEMLALQQIARTVAETHGARASNAASAAEDPPAWATAIWQQSARTNLLGVGVSEEYGGTGGGPLEVAIVLEELACGLAVGSALEHLVASATIDRFGSSDQRARWLPGAVTGDHTLTIAASSHPGLVATAGATGWSVTGSVPCVRHLTRASHVVVPALLDDTPVGLVVDTTAPGVRWTEYATTSGVDEAELLLDQVAIADADVLRTPELTAWSEASATVATCAVLTGVARGALELTAAHANDRHQFGRPLSSFQAVAMHAADAFIDVEAMRLTTWQAAWRLSEGRPAEREVSIAKFWTSEGSARVLGVAQHVHGGLGVTTDYPLHRYLLTAKQLELSYGSALSHLGRMATALA